MSSQKAIGIFDSGFGGLTVVQAIKKLLPNEDLIYFGDTARIPYGDKSSDTICSYALENSHFLLKNNVKAIVIACNTATAFALKKVQDNFPIPILGVIKPTIDTLRKTNPRSIAVLGTKGTIDSRAHQKLIRSNMPHTTIFNVACPLLVPLVEELKLEHPSTDMLIKKYLEHLPLDLEYAILGCTHYHFLENIFRKHLPKETIIINSSESCAKSLLSLLKKHDLINKNKIKRGIRKYFVSDDPQKFKSLGTLLLAEPIQQVSLIQRINNPTSYKGSALSH